MSDTIRVGDRVKDNVTCATGTVLYLKFPWAWVLPDAASRPESWSAGSFTRIEPEPVVLTPKYAVGQRLLSRKGNFVVVKAISLTTRYEFEGWKGFWPEENYKPIPAPCPTCKGSGKSEGVT